jgi:hypothetical protein
MLYSFVLEPPYPWSFQYLWELKMNTENSGFKIFVLFLAFAIFLSNVYACEPVAIVVKEAEGNDSVPGQQDGLTPVGELHAAAYAYTLYKNLLKLYPRACPVTGIRVSDPNNGWSTNPYNTALPFAMRLPSNFSDNPPFYDYESHKITGRDSLPIIYHGSNGPFTNDYNWDISSIKLLADKKTFYSIISTYITYELTGSTFMVFSRQALWADEKTLDIDENRLLAKLLNKKSINYMANLNKIIDEGSPYHNFVYVYSGRQDDGTYDKIDIYFQAYAFSGDKAKCYYIIHGDRAGSDITEIVWQPDRNGCVL